jgi:hypothetical protein
MKIFARCLYAIVGIDALLGLTITFMYGNQFYKYGLDKDYSIVTFTVTLAISIILAFYTEKKWRKRNVK